MHHSALNFLLYFELRNSCLILRGYFSRSNIMSLRTYGSILNFCDLLFCDLFRILYFKVGILFSFLARTGGFLLSLLSFELLCRRYRFHILVLLVFFRRIAGSCGWLCYLLSACRQNCFVGCVIYVELIIIPNYIKMD